jgi:hypothetical protein
MPPGAKHTHYFFPYVRLLDAKQYQIFFLRYTQWPELFPPYVRLPDAMSQNIFFQNLRPTDILDKKLPSNNPQVPRRQKYSLMPGYLMQAPSTFKRN